MASTSQWIAALTEETSLTLATRVLGCHLAARRATWSTGAGIWCAVSTMCECTGLSRATVHRALSALLEGGWIVVTARPDGRPVHYQLNLDRDAGGAPVELDDGAPGDDETGGCLDDGAPVERSVERSVEGPVGSCGKLWKAIGPHRTDETGGCRTGETGGVSPVRHKLSPKLTPITDLVQVAGGERDGGVSLPREGERDDGAPPPASDRKARAPEDHPGAPAPAPAPAPDTVDMEGRALERLALIRALVMDLDALDGDAIMTARPCLADLAPLVPPVYSPYAQGSVMWAINVTLARWCRTVMGPLVWLSIQPDMALLGDDDAVSFATSQLLYEISPHGGNRDLNDDADRAYVWASLRSARAREQWRRRLDEPDIMRHAMTVGMILRWRHDIGLHPDRPGARETP